MKQSLLRALITIALVWQSGTKSMYAQIYEGRTSFGLNATAAKYWGEFTSDLFGYGGDMRLRYDISPSFGIQLLSSISTTPYRITPYALTSFSEYYGGGGYGDRYPNSLSRIDSVNTTRFFHHEILGVIHLLPSRAFVPQLYMGVGVVNHHATVARDNSALPRGMEGRYNEWSVAFPVGLGFECFLSDDISVSLSAITHLSTSDNYDDVAVAGSPNDYVATFGGGLNMYITGEADADQDGLPDKEERRLGLLADSYDTDGDGLSDFEELYLYHTDPKSADSDRDGLLDGEEINAGSSPLRADTDGDGLGDAEELARGTSASNTDSDGDGILDADEVRRVSTNPRIADTDGDGLSDSRELMLGTNPSLRDTDGDTLPDGLELDQTHTDPLRRDTDGDGLDDADEAYVRGSNPRDPDTDDDGLLDGEEALRYKSDLTRRDTDYDGWPDGEEVHYRRTSPVNPDTDGDGIIDSKDPQPCGVRCSDCTGNVPAPSSLPTGQGGQPSSSKRMDYSIRFMRDSDNIDASDADTQKSLKELREYLMNACDKARVTIEGHTSSEGSPAHNQVLSELRANAVKAMLLRQGVPAQRIAGTIGYGSSVPSVYEPTGRDAKRISPMNLENIRRQNRRITVREDSSCD